MPMWLRGVVAVSLWLYTIVAGFFVLYTPLVPLLLIDHTLYRLLADLLFSLWQLYPVGLFQWVFRCQLHHYGDSMRPQETCIIIMNHRTRLDWNYAWIALYHATASGLSLQESDGSSKLTQLQTEQQNSQKSRHPNSEDTKTKKGEEHSEYQQLFSTSTAASIRAIEQNVNGNTLYRRLVTKLTETAKLKYVLKDEIKLVPALGWIMQLNHFLFLKRNWSQDQTIVGEFIDYYRQLQRACNYNYQLLLFPEGTDLSSDNRRRSDAFAAANNLQVYDFVLHPRTTGFAVLCARMRDTGLAAIYDVTLAYDDPPETELDVLRGRFPNYVYVHFKRYEASDLPREEEPLRRWLVERWCEKETALRNFHNHGTFNESDTSAHAPRSMSSARRVFIFWCLVDVVFFIGVLFSSVVRFWVAYNVFLFVAVTWNFGGFHRWQYLVVNR